MKKKHFKKNDPINRACRKLSIAAKKLFLQAREWTNKTFGRRITVREALAAYDKYRFKNTIVPWVNEFLNRNVLVPAT